MKRLLMLLSALALAGCIDSTGPAASDPLTETFDSSLGINLKDTAVWKQTSNGTYYKDEIVGTGASFVILDASDSVFVAYTGWLKDATVFDSSPDSRFAAGRVIVGFLDGMANMRVGGQRLMVIPSYLGFGNSRTGVIPPNATLVFRVKLNGFTN